MSEKILVRATNWVGDLVMTTPALVAIKKSFPDSKISVLVRPPLEGLLAGNPAVDEVILYDKKKYKGPVGIARLARELRKKRFDRAILLQNAFEAALIAFLADIPVRMGYATDGRRLLLTHPVSVAAETRNKHQVHYYLDMLKALGMKSAGDTPRLYPDKADKAEAVNLLKAHGIYKGGPLVGVNPGAQYGVAKKWYPERFGEVADRLISSHGARIIIFGGPGDVSVAAAVQASMAGDALNIAGKTTLGGLMALAGMCRLFITNDTGAMHVAAALGVPTLAVFGSTDPVATGPYGPRTKVVRNPVNCSPCLKRKCPLKHYKCLEGVTADNVYSAASGMLTDE
jgi:lipopolysaccharide heptosyltransferase II